MAPQANGHAYFPFIDGLRAIAVLSVVLYHLDNAWLPGGFAGVDIFFVISGFVVTASVANRQREGLPAFAGYFLARRLQRIAPALIVCLLVTAFVDAVLVPDAWLSHRNQVTGRFAFFGFSNVVMARASNDYFSPIAELNPYTHTWSLGVEEQFYLIFPLLFFLWARGGRWRTGIVGVTATAVLASLAYGGWLGSRDATQAFYVLGTRFWEIGVGVLLFQLQVLFSRPDGATHALPVAPRGWITGASFVALGLTALGLLVSHPASFPVPGAWMVVVGTLGLLAFLKAGPQDNPLSVVLSSRPLVTIGRLSYSLYLWHWPVFVLFRWTVGLEALWLRCTAVLLAFGLAALSYRFVETPVRRSTRLRAWPRIAVVALGLACVFSGLWVMKRITHAQPRLSVSTVTRNAKDWYPDSARVTKAPTACAVTSDVTALATGFRQTFAREACSNARRGPDVFAVGDSHAMALSEMLAGYTRDTGATVMLYNNEGCPFLSLQAWRDNSAQCSASSQRVLDDVIARIKAGDVVFLPSLRMPRFVDQWAKMPAGSVDDLISGTGAADKLAGSVLVGEAVLKRITMAGARVVVTAPNLLLKAPLFRCADVYEATNPICSDGTDVDRAAFEQLRAPMLEAVTRLTRSVPNASVWDPFPVLCPAGPVCHAYRDGHPLFFDGDHLSGYANRLLLPSFERALMLPQAGADSLSTGVSQRGD
jgi:peptidoglycan/LPS O-acetylase OafA/YrhL